MSLQKGSKGDEVKLFQEQLKQLGFLQGNADGAFGSKTKDAVAAFQQAYFVDGIADQHTLDAMSKAVEAWSAKDKQLLLPVPTGLKAIIDQFGLIEFEEGAGGAIHITNDWADQNIVIADLPIVGRQQVHKLMVPVFNAVMEDLAAKGLDGNILTFGVWSPRHKMHNPKNGLSNHSWAIACDVNAATNIPGKVGDLHPGIVVSFERFGFEWGGRWRTRDDMHFQYCYGY